MGNFVINLERWFDKITLIICLREICNFVDELQSPILSSGRIPLDKSFMASFRCRPWLVWQITRLISKRNIKNSKAGNEPFKLEMRQHLKPLLCREMHLNCIGSTMYWCAKNSSQSYTNHRHLEFYCYNL